MKKILGLTLVVAMLFSVAGCSSNSSSSSDASTPTEATSPNAEAADASKDKWVMAINATFPPFESIDEKDATKFVGVDIDIANHIAEKMGVELEINDMQFSALVPTMTSGRADIIVSGISPTEERLEVIDFSEPYFFPMNAIICSAETDYKTLNELEGKKIGVSMGTSYANVAKTVTGAEVMELDSTPLVIQEIVNGRCDAGIFDATQAAEFCKENEGLTYTIIPSDITLGDTFAIAVPKGADYLDDINAILDEMKEDGSMHDILVKWLGEDATARYEASIADLEIAQ